MKALIRGVFLLGVSCQVVGLPVVESRTGEPVVGSLEEVSAAPGASHITLKQIELLKQEISELRGLVEMQEHELRRVKKSQQDFYIDLDKRVDLLGKSLVSKDNLKAALPTPKTEEESDAASEKVDPLALSDKESFELAYSRVRSKEYVKAIVAFQSYLERFPQGEQVVNAHYWIGESYLARWQDDSNTEFLNKARDSFLTITSHFPTHQKATDALLKMGLVEESKGDIEAAKRYLSEVKDRYPGSAAARVATAHLDKHE